MTIRRYALAGTLAAAILGFVLVVGVPIFSAFTASPDASPPPGADELAARIRNSFAEQLDVDIPPLRTVIRRWTVDGHSFMAEVEVFSLAFGASPRRGLALAPCWSDESEFSGGWIDSPAARAELESQFAEAASACSAP